MKFIKSSLLAIALCMLVLGSCKKSSNPSPTAAVSMSMKFNGTAKSTLTVLASYYSSENTLQVIGSFNNTDVISLMIQNVKTGTVTLPSNDIIASYSQGSEFATNYLGETGSITITSFTDTQVTGTFQFTATTLSNTIAAITEGKFSAKVIKISQQP